MRVRRALLFMPGDDRRKIEKGASLGADAIIMDLEDGVAFNRKEAARETIAAALRELDFGRSERLVRINPISDNNLYLDDLRATYPAQPDGYVIPKVSSPADLLAVADWLTAQGGHPLTLLAIIETARGVVNLREIAGAGIPGLQGLIFGGEDLTGDLGAVRTVYGHEVAYTRAAVVLHAKAFDLQAIDGVYTKLDDVEGLTADTRYILEMGYTGKLAIHPRQVEPIQKVFTPTDEEIARAQRLIDAFNEHQAAGAGVFALDGRMVDMPMVRAAQAVLARAQAANIE
jgi:citrate lyase subunit beta-like protein